MRFTGGLALSLMLLLPLTTSVSGQVSRTRFHQQVNPYTRNLPKIERVELLKLKKRGDLWNGEIESRKIVTGIEAQTIATLWRRQSYSPDSAACHFPGYAIKFYAEDQPIVYASLCWECDNIGFIEPALGLRAEFEGKGKMGMKLLRIFQEAFPDSR